MNEQRYEDMIESLEGDREAFEAMYQASEREQAMLRAEVRLLTIDRDEARSNAKQNAEAYDDTESTADNLEAEVARLAASRDFEHQCAEADIRQRDLARAEVERLRGERDDLAEAAVLGNRALVAAEADLVRIRRRLEEAHHTLCSCGGAGPGEGCTACNMWHMVRTAGEGE